MNYFLVGAAIFILLLQFVHSDLLQESQALLSFISQVPHAKRVRWSNSTSVCSWFGVQCDDNKTAVVAIHLPAAGLSGAIPPNTIGKLSHLRVLSFRSNAFSGEVPSDFAELTSLRGLYLQDNSLSGSYPDSLTGLPNLVNLNLRSNNFSGLIPFAISNLTRLTRLFLQENSFSGSLPGVFPPRLAVFNVSNNQLNGSIPESLSRFPAESFSGNLQLCGTPLPRCEPFFHPSPPPPGIPTKVARNHKSKKLSTLYIVLIAVGAALILLLILVILLFIRNRNRRQPKTTGPVAVRGAAPEAGTSSSKDEVAGGSSVGTTSGERNKLIFFEGGQFSFDLEDLLRASAEVLGKGSVGTSYKAVLEEGTTVVVKRLKDVVVSRREFEAQMEALGTVSGDNVVPPRAFYFSKDEKLLVYDYFPAGSLSALLHGSRGTGRIPLDWDSRLKIALSTARGLTHLHVVHKVVHGNIKAANVLLRQDHDAAVSDFGLYSLFGNQTQPSRFAGYRAPESIEARKATFKSDVYSFGVLLLELLTGKAPNQASLGDEGIDLPRWVQSVVREEWTAEVFDVDLMRFNNIEEEMVQALQIAMACVSMVPDHRPSMQDALKMMEAINRDDLFRQSSDDPSKGSDGQTPEESRPTRSLTP